MGCRTIYLVRHGQADRSQGTEIYGGALTDQGLVQARLTADRFHEVSITRAFVSTLPRAQLTASIILSLHLSVPVNRSRLLWEGIPNVPEGYEDEMPILAVTSMQRARRRLDKAYMLYICSLEGEQQTDLIVAHNNLIRWFVVRLLKADEQSWIRMELGNCSVTKILIGPDRKPLLVYLNDISHIPMSIQTY